MLETMIRRDRNHPCVIIWSMANESKTDNEIGIKVMRTLIRRTKELDPTRLVTFVTAPGSVREHRAFEEADLVATNMYHGSLIGSAGRASRPARSAGAAADRRASATGARAFPDKPLLITEFGAMGIHGLHGDVPTTEDFQAEYIRAVWTAISEHAGSLGRRPVVVGRLQPPARIHVAGPIRSLRRGHDRPQAQGGLEGPGLDVRRLARTTDQKNANFVLMNRELAASNGMRDAPDAPLGIGAGVI